MASMLAEVQGLVTPALLSRVSAQTGDSEAAVSKGFVAVIPMLFALLADRSNDRSFMNQVASLAADTAADPDALAHVRNASSGAPGIDTTTPTGGFLSSLFGSNLSNVLDGLTHYAGVGRGTAASILSMAAPLVLGYLGHMMRAEGLNADGLANALRTQRATFTSAIQSGLDSLLPAFMRTPIESLGTMARDAVDRSRHAAHAAATADRTSLGWAVPLIAALALLGGLLFWFAREHPRIDARAANGMSDPVGTSGRRADGLLTRSLPGGVNVYVLQGGMEDRLLTYVADPAVSTAQPVWFEFDRIGFDTASSFLTPESRNEISNVASILKSYPDSALVIAGYTDNVGNEVVNVELSRSRAAAVMNALEGMGVPADRIQAQGFGSQNPVGDNATEEGRALNRRVAMQVRPR